MKHTRLGRPIRPPPPTEGLKFKTSNDRNTFNLKSFAQPKQTDEDDEGGTKIEVDRGKGENALDEDKDREQHSLSKKTEEEAKKTRRSRYLRA